jgi:hypothetical protein
VNGEQVIVRPDDLHAIGYCNRGARAWCLRTGLDWAQFVTSGIAAEELEATGDAMAIRLAQHTREARRLAREV